MLKIVKAGIEWGAAFDVAEARYILWDNVKIGEIYISEEDSLVIEFYEGNSLIVSTKKNGMVVELDDLSMITYREKK